MRPPPAALGPRSHAYLHACSGTAVRPPRSPCRDPWARPCTSGSACSLRHGCGVGHAAPVRSPSRARACSGADISAQRHGRAQRVTHLHGGSHVCYVPHTCTVDLVLAWCITLARCTALLRGARHVFMLYPTSAPCPSHACTECHSCTVCIARLHGASHARCLVHAGALRNGTCAGRIAHPQGAVHHQETASHSWWAQPGRVPRAGTGAAAARASPRARVRQWSLAAPAFPNLPAAFDGEW